MDGDNIRGFGPEASGERQRSNCFEMFAAMDGHFSWEEVTTFCKKVDELDESVVNFTNACDHLVTKFPCGIEYHVTELKFGDHSLGPFSVFPEHTLAYHSA